MNPFMPFQSKASKRTLQVGYNKEAYLDMIQRAQLIECIKKAKIVRFTKAGKHATGNEFFEVAIEEVPVPKENKK